MRKIILVLFVVLIFGCEGGSQEPLIIEDENVFVELGTGFIESGHVIDITPCRNNRGPCGGGFWIKVYSEDTLNFQVIGTHFWLHNYTEFPWENSIMYFVYYSFDAIGEYTGQVSIFKENVNIFRIYMNGEKIR